jgi:hypothetical protein
MQHLLSIISAFAVLRQAACAPGHVTSPRPRITAPAMVQRAIPVIDGTTTRWIGIHTDVFVPANIHGHEKYLTEESGTMKWIASNSASLDDVATVTSEQDGQTVTTTVPAPGASVSVDGSGQRLTFLVPPSTKDKLVEVIEAACGGGGKKMRKRVGSCAYQALENMPHPEELDISLDSLQPIDGWMANDDFAQLLELHGATLEDFAALKDVATSAAMRRYYALALAAFTVYEAKGLLPYLNDVDLSKGIGATTTSTAQASSTSSTCPTAKPICPDKECSGNDALECQATGLKGCRCCPKDIKCSAEDCKGKDDKCTEKKLEGCSCSLTRKITMPWPDIGHGKDVSDQDLRALAQKIFMEKYHGDMSWIYGGDAPKKTIEPTCEAPPALKFGVTPEDANALAAKWCALDRGQDREDDTRGSDIGKDLKDWLHFTYKHADGKCSQNCTEILGQMIKRCKNPSSVLFKLESC